MGLNGIHPLILTFGIFLLNRKLSLSLLLFEEADFEGIFQKGPNHNQGRIESDGNLTGVKPFHSLTFG